MPSNRAPNAALRHLVREADIKYEALATRVNALGIQYGLALRYDKTSVSHWIRGTAPAGIVPLLICRVLAERLRRTVHPTDAGFAPTGTNEAEAGLAYHPSLASTVKEIELLRRYDMERREFLRSSTYASAAVVAASGHWLDRPPDPPATRTATSPRVGTPDVTRVRATLTAFQDLDVAHGGGHTRPLALHYLRSVLDLHDGNYTETTGRALRRATAELLIAIGLMSYDVGHHQAAQRYLIQATRMAQAADDPPLGARALTILSHQALHLGQPAHAVELARRARNGAPRATPGAKAVFHVFEARAHSGTGDIPAAEAAIKRAEHHFARARPDDEPDWTRTYTRAELAGEIAWTYRDLGLPAQTRRYAAEAAAHPATMLRAHGFNHALLATTALQDNDIELACAHGRTALHHAAQVMSDRVQDSVHDVLTRLRPHAAHPRVKDLADEFTAAFPHR
ncbi:transcriptional regulator [Streptomyces sp. NPDC057638]|uniref:transcriptional regulator n=1 Tax=Streptomyces sp. NPDC057638 TaxID=3346190 RepID=UPI003688AAF3